MLWRHRLNLEGTQHVRGTPYLEDSPLFIHQGVLDTVLLDLTY
jgi:hypothetical protein